MTKIIVREQSSHDLELIQAVNQAAFKGYRQSGAFDEFRAKRKDILSLVATLDNQVIGHILFSPARLTKNDANLSGMGLGQLAVSPNYQGKGVGKQLANTGLKILRKNQCPYVIVVGHATYYPKFGFKPGNEYGIRSQWEGIPNDSFMIIFLKPNSWDKKNGIAYFDGL
ncbi:MAG: N-acetyltransferase [Pseudomonadota bacterium]|nr:N-acetyltransferase [Pseudomonadota bacterium]